MGLLSPLRDGAKDERNLDARLLFQRVAQDICQTARFQNQAANFGVERMISSSGVLFAIPVHARFYEAKLRQAIQLLADGPDGEA